MTTQHWILGADDPEMSAIEMLLTFEGRSVSYATVDGVRVHPGNAYSADNVSGTQHLPATHLVECGGDGAPSDAVIMDHHRPGDPGFGKPAEEFLSASSIGQVFAAMYVYTTGKYQFCEPNGALDGGWFLENETGYPEIPVHKDIVFTAAADHCLASAYAGRCHGVDPDKLMQWRVEQRAAFQGRSVAEVMADVEAALSAIRRQTEWHESSGVYECDWKPPQVIDLRGKTIPELPEAAVRQGVAYLSTVTDRDGRVKDVLGGHTTPELVERWMGDMRAAGRETYGDQVRGFAGAYQLT